MKMQVEEITDIVSAIKPNRTTINIDVRMTESQMYDALCEFRERIDKETFQRWYEQLKSDA